MKNKGFTLLELTLVMTLMGILAAIALPNLLHYALIKRDKVAYEAANQFYIKAVAHFEKESKKHTIITVIPKNLNFPYYVLDANIEASGSLTDTEGVISSSSSLEFKHKKSTRVYQLSALGVITIKE